MPLQYRLLLLIVAWLGWISTFAAARADPSYVGVFVIVDPYNSSDMNFLACSAGALSGGMCNKIAAGKTGFSNPFASKAASGILLRIPWCGFQTGRLGQQPAPQGAGECHYRLAGDAGTAATYVAGSFTATGNMQFAAETGVDAAISNLSNCASDRFTYDECTASVLTTALGYISTLNKTAGQPLGLAVALVAGQYTPQSVLNESTVGYVDLPQMDQTVSCTRQPLAWQTVYSKAYAGTAGRLVRDIRTRLGAQGPPIVILKPSSITSNSIEFDVAARTVPLATAVDPSSPGNGPQGDAALQCPDHTGFLNGVAALLHVYGNHQIAGETLAQAYEGAFGYVAGYEAGLLAAQPGVNSILSVPIKGEQVFAHLYCGLDESLTCIADPSPGLRTQYAWPEYYFSTFVDHLFSPGSIAATKATSGFSQACLGQACSPAGYALTPWQLAVVYTGLQTPNVLIGGYATQLSCWLNNTDTSRAAATAMLTLYTSRTTSTVATIVGPPAAPGAPGGGTMLGWQTSPTSGSSCFGTGPTYAATLQDGLANGGQFLEIETDAAAEPTCAGPLQNTLAQLVGGNPATSCVYL